MEETARPFWLISERQDSISTNLQRTSNRKVLRLSTNRGRSCSTPLRLKAKSYKPLAKTRLMRSEIPPCANPDQCLLEIELHLPS